MFDPRFRKRSRRRREIIVSQEQKKTQPWFLLGLAIISWIILLFIIFFIPPRLIRDLGIAGSYLPFFVSLGSALLIPVYLLTHKLYRSLIITLTTIFFLILQLNRLTSPVNMFLIVSLAFMLDYYFKPPPSSPEEKSS